MTRVVIAGHSARAAAESAARAGFAVTALDAFADLDQHPRVRAVRIVPASRQRFTAAAAARGAHTRGDAVVYLSGFENHPRDVSRFAAGRTLWGNGPEILRAVRDPFLVADRLAARGWRVPAIRRRAADLTAADLDDAWLVKPRASGGGRGVRQWSVRQWSVPRWRARPRGRMPAALPRSCHLQAFVPGTPGSVVFVAAGGRAVPLGVSQQLVGEPAFGATGFRYTGSILLPGAVGEGSRALVTRAAALAASTADAFDMVGVSGVDFIACGDEPVPIEINPRWCASMELVEHAFGLSVFGVHAAACADGRLPSFDLAAASAGMSAVGKAIVFAAADLVAGDTRAWLDDPDVRDVPRPGALIPAGQPICTVFADAADPVSCRAALAARAARIYDAVAPWQRHAA